LRRDAGVSGLIVLVLALGIGGNAAIFTLLKAAFLDPLPYRDAAGLVTITESSGWNPSTSGFLELCARTRTIGQLAFAEHLDMQLTGAGEPARVFAARVTASFFPLLGVNAALGRTLTEEENRPGRAPAVVLSDGFWRSRMGADPQAVGRTLRLDGQAATVVGVLPAGFHFDYPSLRIAEPVDLYVSYPLERSLPLHMSVNGLGIPVRVIGRLRAGVALAQAQTDLRDIVQALKRDYPEAFPTPRHEPSYFQFEVRPLRDAIVGSQRSLLWLLLGGVGVLLPIACANAAQLLLARSLGRVREVAVRSALGASRWRLVRQFLLEGGVLAACGGAAGLLLASSMARALVGLLPVRSPLLAAAHVDGRAIGFTLAVSMISALAFAIVPAVKGSRWAPGPSLSARTVAGEGNRWRNAMIAIEAALSVFLLCGAGLVTENLWTLLATPMGFDPRHVLAMRLKLPSAAKQDQPDPKAGRMLAEYLKKIQAIPGVESAATVTGPPLRPSRGGNSELAGFTDGSVALRSIMAWSHQISPDYFRTLGIPLLAGRAFRDNDAGPRISVAIVNQEFARRFGLGADVVDKQMDNGADGPITIVGMVGDVRTRGLQTAPFPEKYFSSLQFSYPNVYLVVRSALPAAQVVKQVTGAIQTANADQAVFGAMTMEQLIADAVTEPRFDVFLIGAFALVAVAMAAAGMYSVIACLVSQRTGEIAIRMALGASRGAIVRTVLGATTVWVAGGLGCGLALALAARNTVRALASAAVEGSAWMYGSMAFFFFAVTFLAAWAPMRRASRLDPAAALRCE